MAQDIRIERGRTEPVARRPVAQEPKSTEEARFAIEETRGRISATLDEIEERIEGTKEQVKEKMNVLRPVRSQVRTHPWPGLGIAFGAGLLFGLLTGGGEEEPRGDGGKRRMLDEDEREELRRWRAERHSRLEARKENCPECEARRSASGQIRQAAMHAAMSGVASRMRRMVTGRSSQPQAR